MRRQTHGTQLQLSDGAASNPTFTAIAQLIRVKPPGMSRSNTEMADHDMTGTKQYAANLLNDVPPVTARGYLDPQLATHQTLLELALSGEVETWRVVLPNAGGTWEFTGFVARYEPDEAPADDGVLEFDIEIQPDGNTWIQPS